MQLVNSQIEMASDGHERHCVPPIAVIPARIGSSRLPGKPLADIAGIPMVVQVMMRGREANLGPVSVVSGEPEFAEAVRRHGGVAIKTDPALPGCWIDNWHQQDFASLGVALDVNDKIAIERQGGHASGDLVSWVAVLAYLRAERGQPLPSGQVVTHRQFHWCPLCRSRRQDDRSGSGPSFTLRHIQTNSTRLRGF
jgi:hypothetical protein